MDGGSDTGSIPVYSTRRKCCKRLFYGTFSFLKGFKNAISDCFVPFEIEKIGEEIGEEKTQWHIVK